MKLSDEMKAKLNNMLDPSLKPAEPEKIRTGGGKEPIALDDDIELPTRGGYKGKKDIRTALDPKTGQKTSQVILKTKDIPGPFPLISTIYTERCVVHDECPAVLPDCHHYQTAVFTKNDPKGTQDIAMTRSYENKDQAVRGHREIVQQARDGRMPN